MERYKLVVFVPKKYAEKVRSAICKAGTGKIGHYDHCTFMSEGTGTYLPLKGAKPFKGKTNKLERVKEVRIETWVAQNKLKSVISAMKKAHPYEEPVYDVYETFAPF